MKAKTAIKNITFNYDGIDYTLYFTRNSIRKMESEGFSVSEYDKKPMTVANDLFRGAFIANHPMTRTSLIDTIFEKISDKEGLFEALVALYQAPFEAMTENPAEGGIAWKAGQ